MTLLADSERSLRQRFNPTDCLGGLNNMGMETMTLIRRNFTVLSLAAVVARFSLVAPVATAITISGAIKCLANLHGDPTWPSI
jgi:hypothetical protein